MVVHCKKANYDVYIGRCPGPKGKWGNPFTHLPHAVRSGMTLVSSREEAIAKYREWILTQQDLIDALPELRGKILGCWCKPFACHGDVLEELSNGKSS